MLLCCCCPVQLHGPSPIRSASSSQLRAFGPKELSGLAEALARLPRCTHTTPLASHLSRVATPQLQGFTGAVHLSKPVAVRPPLSQPAWASLFYAGKQLAVFAEACSTLGLRDNKLSAALAHEAFSGRDASVATGGPAQWGLGHGPHGGKGAPIRGPSQRVSELTTSLPCSLLILLPVR